MIKYQVELVTDNSPFFNQYLGKAKEKIENLTKKIFDKADEIIENLPDGIVIGTPDNSDYNYYSDTINFPLLFGKNFWQE